MKIRSDFVTNSSASSFVVAQKGEFTEKQKAALLDFIIQELLGEKIISGNISDDEFEEMADDEYTIERNKDSIRAAINSGKDIYSGWVSFEDPSNDIADLFQKVWKLLEESGDGNFEIIDGDLFY